MPKRVIDRFDMEAEREGAAVVKHNRTICIPFLRDLLSDSEWFADRAIVLYYCCTFAFCFQVETINDSLRHYRLLAYSRLSLRASSGLRAMNSSQSALCE